MNYFGQKRKDNSFQDNIMETKEKAHNRLLFKSAAVMVFCYLCNNGTKKKSKAQTTTRPPTTLPQFQPNHDLEIGTRTKTSTSTEKDGGMVILAAAGVSIATTAVIISDIDGGGCDGGGACGGGGCGGGGGASGGGGGGGGCGGGG